MEAREESAVLERLGHEWVHVLLEGEFSPVMPIDDAGPIRVHRG